MDWRQEALCREGGGYDADLWFPVGTSGPAKVQEAAAKAVCHRCPVRSDCLAYALATGQDAGVWGGMSEDERRVMKRTANRKALR